MSISIYQDGGYIGSDWTAPFSLERAALNSGNYSFRAVAVSTAGFSGSSAPLSVAVNPSLTAAVSNRYSRGNGTDPTYLAYVIALDAQKGAALGATGTAPFPASSLPWFMRIQKTPA